MHSLDKLLAAFALLAATCPAQQDSGLSPRAIFYREPPDNDQLPAPPAAKATAASAPRPDSSPKSQSSAATGSVPAANTGRRPGSMPTASVIPVVQHLGLRYNVLLATAGDQPADPDRVFNSGECVAFQFEPNRSGYLYVFEQGSSGQWHPLFPSTLLADESNIIRSRTPIRVPAKDCFELNGPAGQERVFVVLSRNPEDLYALNDSMRAAPDSTPPARVERATTNEAAVYVADNLGAQIGRMASLQRRDMALKKVARPEGQGEIANTVYVVNAAQTPSDRIVTEIRLAHK